MSPSLVPQQGCSAGLARSLHLRHVPCLAAGETSRLPEPAPYPSACAAGEGPVGLIICPSRELARQTQQVILGYTQALMAATPQVPLNTLLCIGGIDMKAQTDGWVCHSSLPCRTCSSLFACGASALPRCRGRLSPGFHGWHLGAATAWGSGRHGTAGNSCIDAPRGCCGREPPQATSVRTPQLPFRRRAHGRRHARAPEGYAEQEAAEPGHLPLPLPRRG